MGWAGWNNLGALSVYPEHRHLRSLGLQPEHCLKLLLRSYQHGYEYRRSTKALRSLFQPAC